MNWIKSIRRRPAAQNKSKSQDIPDNIWDTCPGCSSMLYHAEVEKSHFICPHCGYHFRLAPLKRLDMLFDDGQYTLIQLPKTADDPLAFHDLKKYSDRLKEARKKTKNQDAFIAAHGKMGKHSVVIGVLDFAFMAGSMGCAVGEAIVTAVQLALLQEAALILIPASGGARMQEGILSLMQMARTTVAVDKLKKRRLPYLVVLTDPTTGGVTASFAMLGDMTLAEPGATIGFAGSRVIEQTIREKLPPNFQKSDYLLEHGMIDAVVPRTELRPTLIQALNLLMPSRKG